MKPKYKIGMMVEYKLGEDETGHGLIGSFIVTKSNYQYVIEGDSPEQAIHEERIMTAFRPIKTRVTKKKTKVLSSNEKARNRMKEEV